MTEVEWLTCAHAARMIKFVGDKLSTRKALLFAIACCLRIEALLTDARSHSALAALRRYADGRADLGEMEREYRDARIAAWSARRATCVRALGEEAFNQAVR